jgi:hypothetical protein
VPSLHAAASWTAPQWGHESAKGIRRDARLRVCLMATPSQQVNTTTCTRCVSSTFRHTADRTFNDLRACGNGSASVGGVSWCQYVMLSNFRVRRKSRSSVSVLGGRSSFSTTPEISSAASNVFCNTLRAPSQQCMCPEPCRD